MYKRLSAQFVLLQAIRDFFKDRNFIDVMTPPIVANPGMETHIHPFGIYQINGQTLTPFYLHTSPEFNMKRLLSEGFKKIFTLTYSFRDEPNSPTHRPQFIMLEWYRAHEHYTKIMDDCEELIIYCSKYLKDHNVKTNPIFDDLKCTRLTISELFKQEIGIDILDYLDSHSLATLIENRFPQVPLPNNKETLSWDDLYFLLFLNEIEPKLTKYPCLLLSEFPYHLSALSTIKEADPRVCERFEIYLNGIELCNCFNELCDINEQKKRFDFQNKEKQKYYNYTLPEPRVLYQALEKGLPASAGIALGVERLLMALTGDDEYSFWK